MSKHLPEGWHVQGEQPEAADGDGGRSYAAALKHTIAWGPTARKAEPHAFEAGTDNPRWCTHCGSIEDAYAHASAAERAAFDQAQAPKPERPANGMSSTRMALIVHRAMSAHLGADAVGAAPHVTGAGRMPGELVVTTGTGQRFRITVTEMAS